MKASSYTVTIGAGGVGGESSTPGAAAQGNHSTFSTDNITRWWLWWIHIVIQIPLHHIMEVQVDLVEVVMVKLADLTQLLDQWWSGGNKGDGGYSPRGTVGQPRSRKLLVVDGSGYALVEEEVVPVLLEVMLLQQLVVPAVMGLQMHMITWSN